MLNKTKGLMNPIKMFTSKQNKLMYNKRGQAISTTATWGVAMFVVVIICVLFLISANFMGNRNDSSLVKVKSTSGEVQDYNKGELEAFLSVKTFLDSDTGDLIRIGVYDEKIAESAKNILSNEYAWSLEIRENGEVKHAIKSEREISGRSVDLFLNIDDKKNLKFTREVSEDV